MDDDIKKKVEEIFLKYMVATDNGEYHNFKRGYLPRLYYSKLKHLRDDIVSLINNGDNKIQ